MKFKAYTLTFVTILSIASTSCGQELKATKNQQQPQMTIDQILKMDNAQLAVIELDTRVNELSAYGEDLSKLTEPQKVLLFVENVEKEVNNGGFNQFFWNSSGDYAHESLAALEVIGAKKTAAIVRRAIAQWPQQTVPKDKTEREELLEQIQGKAEAVWGKCEEEFFAYEEDISQLLIEYVKKHKREFN